MYCTLYTTKPIYLIVCLKAIVRRVNFKMTTRLAQNKESHHVCMEGNFKIPTRLVQNKESQHVKI